MIIDVCTLSLLLFRCVSLLAVGALLLLLILGWLMELLLPLLV
jgi:hypothetical protein